jgi:hypothetical protein
MLLSASVTPTSEVTPAAVRSLPSRSGGTARALEAMLGTTTESSDDYPDRDTEGCRTA